MTRAKTYQYQIQYTDNTYRMIEWTKAEFKQVGEDMRSGYEFSLLDEGIFSLKDIRAIVNIPLVEEEEEKEIDENGSLTEWGFVDRDTAEWLKNNGIDIGGAIK